MTSIINSHLTVKEIEAHQNTAMPVARRSQYHYR